MSNKSQTPYLKALISAIDNVNGAISSSETFAGYAHADIGAYTNNDIFSYCIINIVTVKYQIMAVPKGTEFIIKVHVTRWGSSDIKSYTYDPIPATPAALLEAFSALGCAIVRAHADEERYNALARHSKGVTEEYSDLLQKANIEVAAGDILNALPHENCRADVQYRENVVRVTFGNCNRALIISLYLAPAIHMVADMEHHKAIVNLALLYDVTKDPAYGIGHYPRLHDILRKRQPEIKELAELVFGGQQQ